MFKFINQSTIGVKTAFGKYVKNCKPGIQFYWPFIEKIDIVSNRISQTSFKFDTKTKNDVFVRIGITIEYVIKEEDSDKAFFSMKDPLVQIGNNVENVVITSTSGMDLNTLFESRESLCANVAKNLSDMQEKGYTIIKTLVTSIDVDKSVRDALNKVYESKKMLEATENQAEAEKIRSIKSAEAEKESKILQGQGTAGQRNAILSGFSDNIEDFKAKFGIDAKQVFDFVLCVQHLDMLKEVGSNSKSNVVFLNHDTQNNNIIKGLYGEKYTDHHDIKKINDINL